MKLPRRTATAIYHAAWGRYTARRLARASIGTGAVRITDPARVADMERDVHLANSALLAAARALEDAELPVDEAIADRDIADDALDAAVRKARLDLAARFVGAERTVPYVKVFPQGVTEYTDAKLPDQAFCYGLFVERVEEFVPADDPVRVAAVAAVSAGLGEWRAAVALVDEARQQREVLRAQYEAALDAWEATMRATYGGLLGLGLTGAQADRFFRKAPGPKKAPAGTEPTSA